MKPWVLSLAIVGAATLAFVLYEAGPLYAFYLFYKCIGGRC